MAKIKKNQMANIVFPIVDGVDFASIESGITASNFESKMTKKFFGVTHGNSTAFTSGTISKAATLVRSGIFQQTLKAAETNYDYILYSFAPANTSLAQQVLVFQTVDYDDSDIFSQLSDIGSNLLSYLTGMSGAISDVESQVDLLATSAYLSDIQSNLLSYMAGMSGVISDAYSSISDLRSTMDSQFTWESNMLSDMLSDLTSQIGGITASVSVSDISDIASRVWSEKYTAHSAASSFGSLFSDIYSRVVLLQSNASDIESALDSQFVWNSAFLSDMNSDLGSKIGNVSVTLTASDISDIASAVTAAGVNLTASDMSDIASRVWATTEGTRVDSRILVMQSMVSDVDSQLLLTASAVSDVYSLLSDHHSDFQSRVAGTLATSNYLSQVHSDVSSKLTANYNLVSDVDSQLTVTHSLLSDVESAVDALNDPTVAAIASAVLNSPYSDHVAASTIGSRIQKIASDISDIDSALTLHDANISGMISDVDSQLALTDASLDSQFLLALSAVSDAVSAATAAKSQAIVAASNASDAHSLTLFTATYISSNVSDIGVQVDTNASMISDIQSQLDVTHSLLSDVESAVDAMWITALTESYNVDGAEATAAQALYMIMQALTEFTISGTTLTGKKLDGSTTAFTLTLNDGTNPTGVTRAT